MDKISKIKNSFDRIINEDPTIGYGIKFYEDKMTIFVSSYVNYLNEEAKKRESVAEAYAKVEFLLKKCKENYSKEQDGGGSLKVKFIAENYDVETFSLNNRHKLTVVKMFQIL